MVTSKKDEKPNKKEDKKRQKILEELEKAKLEQERLQKLRTLQQKQASLRKIQLSNTKKASDVLTKRSIENEKLKQKEFLWKRYLNPKQIPVPNSPPDLRSYLIKWKDYDVLAERESIDIRVKIDERSILTQNIHAEDKTYDVVMGKRKAIGDEYIERIKEVTGIIEELNEVMLVEKHSLKERVYKDLEKLRLEIRKVLHDYIDKWTFGVLLHIDTDMTEIDPISSFYWYSSEVVKHYLWCFKEVPLPYNYFEVNNIKIPEVNCEYTNSTEIDLNEKALRGLWHGYDHFSDLANHFFPPKAKATTSLRESLFKEEEIIEELRIKKLNEMKEERAKYEAKLETERLSIKDKKLPKKAKKSKSEEIEPPIVTEDTLVDISVELEEKFLEEFQKSKIFDLDIKDPFEVNLRKFHIIGGIYEINLLQRPRQLTTLGTNFFLRLVDTPDILQYEEFHYPYKVLPKPELKRVSAKPKRRQTLFEPDLSELSGERKSSIYIQPRKSSIKYGFENEEDEMKWMSENRVNERKMFEIKLQLPKKVHWWKIPKVCRWEPWIESEEFQGLSPEMKNYNLNYDKIMEKEAKKLFKAPEIKPSFKKTKELKDFNFSKVPNSIDSHALIKHYLVPRMPDDYKFKVEKEEEAEEKRLEEIAMEERRKTMRMEEKRRNRESFEELRRSWKEKQESLRKSQIEAAKKEQEEHEKHEIVEGALETILSNVASEENEDSQENPEKSKKEQRESNNSSIHSKSKESSIEKTQEEFSDDFAIDLSRLTLHSEDQRRIQAKTISWTEAQDSSKSDVQKKVDVYTKVKKSIEKKPPKTLFPKKKKLRPLEVVQSKSQVNPPIQEVSKIDENSTNLSEFMKHLEILNESEKPFFHSDSFINEQEAKRQAVLEEKVMKKKKQKEPKKTSFYTVKRFNRHSTRSFANVSRSKTLTIGSAETITTESTATEKRRRRTTTKSSNRSSLSSKSRFSEPLVVIEDKPVDTKVEKLKLIPHSPGRWTTRGIHCYEFCEENKIITFRSCSFGSFGLYIEKYIHFPYKKWNVKPISDKIVEIFLETQFTKIQFRVTSDGFMAGIFMKTKSFLEEVVAVVEKPVDLKILIKKLKEININVFPEPDAGTYIDPNYQKHDALEVHSLTCMAFFCLTHQFRPCFWNKYASHRNILLEAQHLNEFKHNEHKEELNEILLTPHEAKYVHTTEDYNTDVNDKTVRLRLTSNPPHQSFNADLRCLLYDQLTIKTKKVFDTTNSLLQHNVNQLLRSIKIFSFSE